MKKAAEKWLLQARADLKAANMLSKDADVIPFACFHAQQAAEKALKAYLASQRRRIPKTHDLMELIGCCASTEPSFNDLADEGVFLNPFYIEARYPPLTPGLLTADIASRAIQAATKVLETVRKTLV